MASWSQRIPNILFGAIYTLAIAATMLPAPTFYRLFGAIEVTLTGAVVWQACRWPRAGAILSDCDEPAGQGASAGSRPRASFRRAILSPQVIQ